ncbi:hypothetical protein ABW19_dt0200044 [Dactylella cylindrospora]|nr:hypothetical protein ABW19_dt0200044 [Dactylella cylindrospora]
MFLYAKVVLGHLHTRGSRKELREELSLDNFPTGLNAAYERIVSRILDPEAPRGADAKKILGWIVVSKRHLRWREIQALFCICLEPPTADVDNSRVDGCKVICGSLVEVEDCEDYKGVESEQIIKIVHQTASKYLCKAGKIHLLEEHAKMAIFCSQYLSSNPFLDGLDPEDMRKPALDGYYALQDYACESWQHHVRSALEDEPEKMTQVVRAANNLLDAYSPKDALGEARKTAPYDSNNDILSRMSGWDREGGAQLAKRTLCIRSLLENTDASALDEVEREAFEKLNGEIRFKCQRLRCSFFEKGFLTRDEREKHTNEHDRPFKCCAEGCYGRTTGFSSQSALTDHCKRLHAQELGQVPLFGRKAPVKPSTIPQAATVGDLETLKKLHRMGGDLKLAEKLKSYITPLILAIRNDHPHICEYLVAQGVDPFENIESSSGRRLVPIVEALNCRDLAFIRALIQFRNSRGPSRLYNCSSSIFKTVRYALKHNSEELLDEVLEAISIEDLLKGFGELLKEISVSTHIKDLKGLETGRAFQHKILQRVYPDCYNVEKRCYISSEGKKILPTFLDDALFGPNGAMYDRFSHCSFHVTEFLLDVLTPQDLTKRSKNGYTILHYLAQCASPNNSFQTECHTNVMRRLAQIGDGLEAANQQGNNGNLPLHRVYSDKYPKSWELLIKHTNNLNQRNKQGKLIIENAIERSNKQLVQLLVESGRVDLSLKTSNNKTPLEYTQEKVLQHKFLASELQDIIKILESHCSENPRHEERI